MVNNICFYVTKQSFNYVSGNNITCNLHTKLQTTVSINQVTASYQ